MPLNQYLRDLGGGETIHDYGHAALVFRSNTYRLFPKYSFLFYVRFNLNPEFTMFTGQKKLEVGTLVKTVSLPKFGIDLKNMNAYNRVNLVQTKVKYDPVTIKFHDDGANVIRELWYDYYSFYYRDSDHAAAVYGAPHKYQLRTTDSWGYGLRAGPTGPGSESKSSATQLINSVQIFSFNQKRFSECKLVNPMISTFRHGDHDYANGTGLLENEMTLQFETVTYASGYVTDANFGSDMFLYYDTTPSNITPLNMDGGTTGGTPGTDLVYDEDGNLVKASSDVSYYRGGDPESTTEGRTGGTYTGAAAGGAGGVKKKTENSAFSKAATGILTGVVQSAIRGRNPLSQFSAPNITNLMYQAGSAVGGKTGQKIIAAGGLVKAGQNIARGGVGPGNLGSVAVAIQSASVLTGVRPQDLLSKITSKKATTNGESVARPSDTSTTVSAPTFPDARPTSSVETSKQGIFSTPRYSDGPATMNDAADTRPSSNQGDINQGVMI